MFKRLSLLALLSALLLTSTHPAAAGNLLANPDFSELRIFQGELLPHRLYQGRAEHAIAHGWEYYFRQPGPGQNAPEANVTGPTGPWSAPVYFPAFRDGVTGDQTAQKIFCFYTPCDTGIYQTVSVPPGELCTLSTTVTQIISQQDWERTDIHTNTAPGSVPSTVYHWVDPHGGTNPYTAQRTTFSAQPVFYMGGDPGAVAAMSAYAGAPVLEVRTLSSQFRASGPRATVGVGFAPPVGFQHQNIWIMAATLTCGPQTAPPAPPSGGAGCQAGTDVRGRGWQAFPLVNGLRVRSSPQAGSPGNWTGGYVNTWNTLTVECAHTSTSGDVWLRVRSSAANGWVAALYQGGQLACLRGDDVRALLPASVVCSP